MLLILAGFVAHVAAAFGLFWLLAFAAHLFGAYEDPRIVEMAGWERAIMVLWGLASIGWWRQWSRMRREGGRSRSRRGTSIRRPVDGQA